MRDLPDLQHVSLLFAQRLLCLAPSPALGAPRPARSPEDAARPSAQPLAPADLAVDACARLFRGRHTAQLAALQRLLPADGGDMRLLFFRVRAGASLRQQSVEESR